jgi:hypothetical protein
MDTPETVASASPHAIHSRAQGASLIQVESSKLVPLIVVLSILCGMAIFGAVSAFYQATLAEREARMLEYYVLEMDAKLIAAGVKKPEEAVADKLKEK